MRWLLIYDIRDHRRLARVARIMGDYGVRVQKSKFELDLDETSFNEMMARLASEIDPAVDGIKAIPLCLSCRGKIEVYGVGGLVAPPPFFEVL